jgi:glycosyltransferase involved in cell wall biosynthesis
MNSLSILHISTADNVGGSGRSAFKIHRELKECGIDSKMLVSTRVTSDPDIDFIHRRLSKFIDRIASMITDYLGLQYLYIPSSMSLLRHPWFKQSSIVQLYNTHGHYFSHSILPAVSRKKKIVWRLSDMWPMTGHCAYSGECEKWKTGCRGCPDIEAYPPIRRDSAAFLWKHKKYLYRKSSFHVVAPSSWIKEIADESPLFAGFSKTLIPNGFNTNIFKPLPKEWCRKIMNIPDDKKIILFIVHSFNDNQRKGTEFFLNAIRSLWETRRDFRILLVGDSVYKWGLDLPCDVLRHDFVKDDELLAMIYNAADLNIHPAVLENMPNSILEAMSCGVPSVAFDTGGVKDAMEHKKTGYLARFKDVDDLVGGMKWLMDVHHMMPQISEDCRRTVLKKFSLKTQNAAFIDLYRQLLGQT